MLQTYLPHRRRAFRPTGPGGVVNGLQIWLKADEIAGLSDTDPVTTWADSTINGNDFTQSTAANKPIYRTSVQNGLPGVDFDGSNDILDGPAVSAFESNDEMTWFFAVNPDSTGGSSKKRILNIVYDNMTDPGFTAYYQTGSGKFEVRKTVSFDIVAGSVSAVPHVFIVRRDSSKNIQMWIDTTAGTTDGPGDIVPGNMTELHLGDHPSQSDAYNGLIFEVIAYSKALSSTDRATVESYLATKWAI